MFYLLHICQNYNCHWSDKFWQLPGHSNSNMRWILLILLFSSSAFIKLNFANSSEEDICTTNNSDISCNNLDQDYRIILKNIEEDIDPNPSQIFFIESLGRDHLLPKHVCTIGKKHSLLDNAPNYVIGYIIQKSYALKSHWTIISRKKISNFFFVKWHYENSWNQIGSKSILRIFFLIAPIFH